MGKIKQSKRTLFVLCIVGVFLVVYGSAIVLRLLLGNFLLDGGLINLNYLLLTLLCVVPFLLYLLISKNYCEKVTEVILISGLFFLTFFVYSNFMLVFSMTEQSQAIAVRLLMIYPTLALILVVVLHFTQGSNVGSKNLIER